MEYHRRSPLLLLLLTRYGSTRYGYGGVIISQHVNMAVYHWRHQDCRRVMGTYMRAIRERKIIYGLGYDTEWLVTRRRWRRVRLARRSMLSSQHYQYVTPARSIIAIQYDAYHRFIIFIATTNGHIARRNGYG